MKGWGGWVCPPPPPWGDKGVNTPTEVGLPLIFGLSRREVPAFLFENSPSEVGPPGEQGVPSGWTGTLPGLKAISRSEVAEIPARRPGWRGPRAAVPNTPPRPTSSTPKAIASPGYLPRRLDYPVSPCRSPGNELKGGRQRCAAAAPEARRIRVFPPELLHGAYMLYACVHRAYIFFMHLFLHIFFPIKFKIRTLFIHLKLCGSFPIPNPFAS